MSTGREDSLAPDVAAPAEPVPVALTRTSRGWAVTTPHGSEDAGDLVEGLSLADLIAEELGALVEPDRTARRSARGPGGGSGEQDDPADARVAALERTVAQLEHALAARVSTERAIGVLAERHGTSARDAFEALRRDARSHGRPVADVAREVLAGLSPDAAPTPTTAPVPAPAAAPAPDSAPAADARAGGRSVPAPGRRRPGSVVAAVAPAPRAAPAVPRAGTGTPSVAAADGPS